MSSESRPPLLRSGVSPGPLSSSFAAAVKDFTVSRAEVKVRGVNVLSPDSVVRVLQSPPLGKSSVNIKNEIENDL